MSEVICQKLGTIYKITNKINSKSYIGLTTRDINWYIKQHFKSALNGSDKYFHKAIRKYGSENFKWKILYQKVCTIKHLCYAEKFFISYYNSQKQNGYNISSGGEYYGLSGQLNPCSKTNMSKKERENKAIKSAKTMQTKIDLKTGLTIAKMIGIKNSKTKNKIDPKTGLTNAQLAGLKISKTMKERDTTKGKNSPLAKKWKLINPNGKEYFICGTFIKFCKEHNLSYTTLRYNKNKQVPNSYYQYSQSKFKKILIRNNTTGWILEEIKLNL